MKERMELVFYRLGIDTDNNGQISRKEFQEIVENHEATKVISELGVDVVHQADLGLTLKLLFRDIFGNAGK
jgi:hypothetical protein